MDIVTYALCKKMASGKGEKGDKGDKGDRGEQGLPGRDGIDGITPNLQVGTVTTLPSGQNATVTQSGTKEDPIFNFSIPRGDKGIYVGAKDSAPPTVDIVIDHSDDGFFPGGSANEELVETPIVGNILTLTKDKYQTTKMLNGTTIDLPVVDKFTEIHLFFSTLTELTVIFPNIKWQTEPTIEANKTYEFIFTYTTEWLGGSVVYTKDSDKLSPVTKGMTCWLDGRDGRGNETTWKDRSGNNNDFALNGFTFGIDNGWTGTNLKVDFAQYAIKEITLGTNYTIELDLFADGTKANEQTTFFYFGDGNASGAWRETFFRKDGTMNNSPFAVANANRQHRLDNNALKRYHLTLMGEPNKIYLYIDGVKIYEEAKANINSNFTANLYLGSSRTNEYCRARFNSVKIYNRVLTEQEVKQNYDYEQSIKRG